MALKITGRYLNHTKYHGLVLNPNSNIFKHNSYTGSDFAGIFGHEKTNDTECVNSCTGFLIIFAGFPVLWVFKLQTRTSLSTMESEIISLDHWCRELFPIIYITVSFSEALYLPIIDTILKFYIREDNVGALVLEKIYPPKFTPFQILFIRIDFVLRGDCLMWDQFSKDL